jgi:hypothetical protein
MSHGHASYVIDGDDRRASLTIEADSADGAGTIRERLELRRSRTLEALRGGDVRGRPYADEWVRLYEDTEIDSDGTTVTVSVDDAATTVPILLVPFLPHFPSELIGRGEPQAVRPEVRFSFAFDADAGLLTITHHGGDTVRADTLTIEGEGFADVDGADLTSPGPWVGETSGSTDGEPAIVAGDSVTVGAEPDYRFRLVWESPGGSAGTLLGSDRGPEA